MIEVWQYARERWEVYGDRHLFAPFTVMAPDGDRQAALERAMDRMADVNNRNRRGYRR